MRFTPPRLRLEAIGFFNDYQNLTSICTIRSGCPGQEGMQFNAGRAHIYGAEFFARADNTLAPGYAIPVIAAYTYTRTRVARGLHARRIRRWAMWQPGDELPFVPRHQAAATVAFETPVAALAVAGMLRVGDARARRAGAGDARPSRSPIPRSFST